MSELQRVLAALDDMRWNDQGDLTAVIAEDAARVIRELSAEVERRADFMASRGYRPCDIPACNCGSWHGGFSYAHLSEIREELDTNGTTILGAVQKLKSEVERLKQERDEALAARETYAMTARQDIIEKAKALDEMEAWLGLHQQVEMRYVVDGYEVSLSNDDGSSWEWEDASTLAAAIRAALEKARAE